MHEAYSDADGYEVVWGLGNSACMRVCSMRDVCVSCGLDSPTQRVRVREQRVRVYDDVVPRDMCVCARLTDTARTGSCQGTCTL